MESRIAKDVRIDLEGFALEGHLSISDGAQGLVLFAHGSGSSRHSTRNRFVAEMLNRARLGTLLFDLLTEEEEQEDQPASEYRFDIPLLSQRVGGAVRWAAESPQCRGLAIGIFGASTGAAAALNAAAAAPDLVRAVVSRGGRPDLALENLGRVQAPTRLIVGGLDEPVIEMNQKAFDALISAPRDLLIVPGATHLFPEEGKLEQVSAHTAEWFGRYLGDAAAA